jgi:hypothetical protein
MQGRAAQQGVSVQLDGVSSPRQCYWSNDERSGITHFFLPRRAYRWYAMGYERSVDRLQHVGEDHRPGIRRMPSERRLR